MLLRTIIFFSAIVGLWLIWANVQPALSFLEDIQLWSYSSEVDGVRQMVPITLANLMVAIIRYRLWIRYRAGGKIAAQGC